MAPATPTMAASTTSDRKDISPSMFPFPDSLGDPGLPVSLLSIFPLFFCFPIQLTRPPPFNPAALTFTFIPGTRLLTLSRATPTACTLISPQCSYIPHPPIPVFDCIHIVSSPHLCKQNSVLIVIFALQELFGHVGNSQSNCGRASNFEGENGILVHIYNQK